MPWETALAKFLHASAKHREAESLYFQTARTFDKLARRIGEERAWEKAGMTLADERSVRAYAKKWRALEKLSGSLAGTSTVTKLRVAGRVKFAEVPEAANRNSPSRTDKLERCSAL